jgi:hypothetical protein
MEIEEKLKIIENLKELIRLESEKVVICYICKRKFANKAHLLRHQTSSKLHKKLNKIINNC